MEKLVKANLLRLVKYGFFWFCMLVAVILTYVATDGSSLAMVQLHNLTPNECMLTVGGAVFGFLAIFLPVWQGAEFTGGVIRNKLIMGYSQKEIYLAHLITSVIIIAFTDLIWIVTGVSSGASVNAALTGSIAVILFSQLSFASLLTWVMMRSRNMILTAMLGVMFFYVSFFAGLITNALSAYQGDMIVGKTAVFLENVNPVGQWFTQSLLCNDRFADAETGFISYGVPVQILLAVAVIALSTVLGLMKINEKDGK